MLSQQELADRAGVSLFTVQRIERGEGSVRPKTGRAIAGALGVGVEDLLGKAPAPLPDFEDERRPPLQNTLRRREFLEHIKTLDGEALAALSNELDEQHMRAHSVPELEDVVTKGLMVRLQMRLVDNPDARFEPVETERKLAALAAG
jgi:transcriptional regulator with XRE-family HTH domain